MTTSSAQITWLRDPRLAVHALAPSPVWLWSADASRILWANPVAAAVFDAVSPGAIESIVFDSTHPAAAQIKKLAGTLPQGDMPRLERLRGFGASLGSTLICLCSRFTLADNRAGVLVVSTERAGSALSLPERARRLLLDLSEPSALFNSEGEFVEANAAACALMGAMPDIAALGAEDLAREATLNGHAEGPISSGTATVLRLGAGATFLLLLRRAVETADASPEPEVIAAARAGMDTAAPENQPAAADGQIETPTAQVYPLPLRFVWQMDAANRFTQGIEDFTNLLGPKTAAVLLTESWDAAAEILKLDPKGEVSRALASHHTWSGIVVNWPMDGSDERLPIEMSGLPVFDRDRQFAGFRGFAVCRDARKTVAGAQMSESVPPDLPQPAPSLSPGEHSAFKELARELGERLKAAPAEALPATSMPPAEPAPRSGRAAPMDLEETCAILDKLPVGVLIYRADRLLYANRAFLAATGHHDLDALAKAGGLDNLFADQNRPRGEQAAGCTLAIASAAGDRPVEGRLFSVPWCGETALMLTLATVAEPPIELAALRQLRAENRELASVLDTATDGVLILDNSGRVLSANRSAQALFGIDAAAFAAQRLVDLFAPESKLAVLDQFGRVARNGAGALNAGREAIGRAQRGGLVPLFLTMGRLENGEKICAVLRDLTAWKRSEEELINARREAERSSTAKSDFLAKISHEIRTPLNAIIGFAEVMMDERFGPIGNERYRQYLKDIHASGAHLISLVNELLDLSKIEAGKLDLMFVSIDINQIAHECVAMLQQEANRERVIVRCSLASNLPAVIADARSVRQIVLNLLSNSIKFTGAGGQVILSTALDDRDEVVLRVRDTGHGMNEEELETALQPFRQTATASRWGAAGTGLGLPITKALAEANHARFAISSRVDSGTLVEIAFPPARMAAQ